MNIGDEIRLCFTCWCFLQNKYKQSGKKSMSSSLYAQLPQTPETQFVAKVSELQSEVDAHVQYTNHHFLCI